MEVNRCLNSGGCRVVRRACCQGKMKETSCLLGVEPVAGKSSVKESINLCESLPITDSTVAKMRCCQLANARVMRFSCVMRVKLTEFGHFI